ncbi:MAG: glycosyltransferase family 2 protein [Acidobacteriota bacterium]
MTETSETYLGCFPPFEPAQLALLRGPLPTWGLSTESSWQQWGLAEAIVRSAPGNQVLMSAAAGLLSWAWQQRPLSATVLAMLLPLDGAHGFLAPDVRQAMLAVKKSLRPLPPTPLWEEVKATGDNALAGTFLEQAVRGQAALSWLGEAWDELVALPDRDRAKHILDQAGLDAQLRSRLAAELDHAHGLAPAIDGAGSAFAPWRMYMAGLLAAENGNPGAAVRHWLPLWRVMPWHSNLTMQLACALRAPKRPKALPPTRTAILAYSWNKAALIAQTIESLFASDIGDNPVFVLDNGSTDATPDALAAARDRYGAHRLSVVTLPVNVGAPAARNWLLSLPQVRACERAAFLDDDVILPKDWLALLLDAALRHPECSTVGCAIRDHSHPHRLQSADYHLLHRLAGQDAPESGERLRVFSNCTGMRDSGLFGYERACMSVSGCCHLLETSLLEKVGGFDVRFTPTQFDDLDRDIRTWLAGKPCLYTGRLRIDHVQNSSMRQASTPAQIAHIQGNKIKLESKYTDEQLDALVQADHDMAWRQLLDASRELQAALQGKG